MERTQVYLTKRQITKLKEAAKKKKTTLSEMVREAIDVQYEQSLRPLRAQRREETHVEVALRISSLGEKGPKDLSSRLDEYLYGGI